MDVDTIHTGNLTETQKAELMKNNQCFYCQKKGHRAKECYSVTIWTATVRYFSFSFTLIAFPLDCVLPSSCHVSPYLLLLHLTPLLLVIFPMTRPLESRLCHVAAAPLRFYIYPLTRSDSFPHPRLAFYYDTARTSTLVRQLPSMYLSWLSMESWALSLTWYSIQVLLLQPLWTHLRF